METILRHIVTAVCCVPILIGLFIIEILVAIVDTYSAIEDRLKGTIGE